MLNKHETAEIFIKYLEVKENTKLPKINKKLIHKNYQVNKIEKTNHPNIFHFEGMESDFTRELINNINIFRLYIRRLKAWSSLLEEYNEEKKPLIYIEFIGPLADYCLNRPYSIRNKLKFALTHLIHQSRCVSDINWDDSKLPNDKKIDYKTLKKIASNWVDINAFSTKLSDINCDTFQEITSSYRHRSHHRFPRNIEFGNSLSFNRRKINEGIIEYHFGCEHPITINSLIEPLLNQHIACINTFDNYWIIVIDQMKVLLTTR